MSEDTHKTETLVQYLLGVLPESETERLAELSLTDEDFADSLSAAEKDLVDSYVQGELRGADLERFTTNYLVTPIRRERVSFAEAFQNWPAKDVAKDVAREAATIRPREKGTGQFSRRFHYGAPWPAFQWALVAAALIVIVAAGALLFQNLRLRQQLKHTEARRDELLHREQELQRDVHAQRSANSAREQELARLQTERERLEQELAKAGSGASRIPSGGIVSFLLTTPLRGVEQVPALSVPPGTGRVKMLLQLGAVDHSAYRVALVDPARNQTLWVSRNLKPNGNEERKTIEVTFPAELLRPQDYLLRMTGIAGDGGSEIVGDYAFKIVK